MRVPMITLTLVSILVVTTSCAKNYVEIPTDAQINGTTYAISLLTPKIFVKTDEFTMTYDNCLQFSFKLMDKRVRLHAYTCLLGEGGFCTLDKFYYPRDEEGCTYLRPWSIKNQQWSFYFTLEKRARKFGKNYKLRKLNERRIRRRQILTAEPIGELKLYGIFPCSEACGNRDDALGAHADNTFHDQEQNRLN